MNKKLPPTQISQRRKKTCRRLMRSAVIKKVNQDKQQNQTPITTNINYIQNIMFI